MAKVSSKLIVAAGAAIVGAIVSSKSFTGSTYRILNKNENYSPLINSLYSDLEIVRKKSKIDDDKFDKVIENLEALSRYIESSNDDVKINKKIKALTKKIRLLSNL